MAQLWGGRFTKETDKLVYNFNASIGFDQKFFHQDVQGSKAHVTDRKSTRLNSSHNRESRMPSSA